MKKSILFIFCISLFITTRSFSQFDFENWVIYDHHIPFLGVNVANTLTSNRIFPFIGQSTFRTTERYEGQYAIRLVSKNIFNTIYPGSIGFGVKEPDYTSLDYKKTRNGFPLEGGNVMLSMFYKFESKQSADAGKLSYRVFRNGTSDFLIEKDTFFKSDSVWQKFTAEFRYEYEEGDSIHFVVYGSDQATTNDLFIDNVALLSFPVSNVSQPVPVTFSVYPNPVHKNVSPAIVVNASEGISSIDIYHESGAYLGTRPVIAGLMQLEDIPTGKYFLKTSHGKSILLIVL